MWERILACRTSSPSKRFTLLILHLLHLRPSVPEALPWFRCDPSTNPGFERYSQPTHLNKQKNTVKNEPEFLSGVSNSHGAEAPILSCLLSTCEHVINIQLAKVDSEVNLAKGLAWCLDIGKGSFFTPSHTIE